MPALETLARIVHTDCPGTHASVTELEICAAEIVEAEAQYLAEMAGEIGYERHLERAGYDDARFQEDMERRAGVIPFNVALAAAEAAAA